MAVANGRLHVDQSPVWGNATLFNGTVIQTANAKSELQLQNGGRIYLAAGSRATVYQHRTVLEGGYSQIETPASYEIEARSLRIAAAAPETAARIRLDTGRSVTVATLRGNVRVMNAAGLLVANIAAGMSLDFEPQAGGAAAPTRASGCLLEKSGKYILVEQTTSVILQLQGVGLAAELGNRVEITGAADPAPAAVPGASQVLNVARVRRLNKGGCTDTAKKLGAVAVGAGAATAAGTAAGAGTATAAGAAGVAAGAGIGAGTVAVIGGIAAAATVGGLAVAGSLPGQGDSPPAASR
jgi:hypothetical protein